MDQTIALNNEVDVAHSEDKVLKIVEFSPSPESLKSRVTPINPRRAANILQDEGYRALVGVDEDSRIVISSSDEWKFEILFYNDIGDGESEDQFSFRIYSGYKINFEHKELLGKAAATLNSQQRYIKAYVAGDEEYSFTEVEMDYMCIDGISDNGFMGVVRRFLYLRHIYREHYRECLKQLS